MTLYQLPILSRRSDRARDNGERRELDDRLFFGWTLVNTISKDDLSWRDFDQVAPIGHTIGLQ